MRPLANHGDIRDSVSGLDPYDALRGTRVPRWARRHPRARQMVIQARKRTPFSLARFYGVRPFVMAKTCACFAAAAARRDDRTAAEDVLALLARLESPTVPGAWGYEFDVQTRWAFYPAGSPNLIATVFVARGFGTAGVVTGSTEYLRELQDSAEFLSTSLLRAGNSSPYFCYTLTSERLVHNANLLGAGLIAMAGSLDGDTERVGQAVACSKTTIAAQRDDGSWPYGEGASLGWSDNFHTAYNLDGLLQVWLASGDPAVKESLDRGVEHWVRDFFGPEGEPKYFPHKAYPYDIHSAGTAVDVAARLSLWGYETADLAERVAAWTAKNLVNPATGVTYYQKHRLWTDKRHFVRWGDAHWALGRSSLALMREGRRDPLERAVAAASGVLEETDAR